MSENNGQMNAKVLDLMNPKDQRSFREHVAKIVIEAVSSKLGLGFTAYDQKTIPFQKDMPGIWNAVVLDLGQYDKLDIIIDKLIEDMVKTKVNHFVRLPNGESHTSIEKDGIVIRVGIDLWPKPTLIIDYKGWSEVKK